MPVAEPTPTPDVASPWVRRAAVGLLLLFVVLAGHRAWVKSDSYDEPFTLLSGWAYVQTGDFSFNREHPPLGKLLIGLALLPLDPVLPDNYQNRPAAAYAFLARQPHVSPRALLFAARLPGIALGVVLLLYVWRWAALAFGWRAGLLALTLAASNSNLLGLSGVAGNDFAVTVFAFAAAFHCWRWLHAQCGRSLVWATLMLGLALGSKFTTLLLLPAIGLAVLAAALARRRPALVGHALLALLATGGVLWLIYLGEARSLDQAAAHGRFQARFQQGEIFFLPFLEGALQSVFGRDHAIPLLSLIKGVDHQLLHADHGHLGFFWGQSTTEGHPAFYLVTGALKNPVGLVLLLVLGLLSLRRTARGAAHELLLYGFTLIMLFVFSRADVQLGFKYMLPAVPFLCVMASRVLAPGKDGKPGSMGRGETVAAALALAGVGIGLSLVFREPGPATWVDALPAVIGALLACVLLLGPKRMGGRSPQVLVCSLLGGWSLLFALAVHPHHLSAFNEWAGGPEQGMHYSVIGDDWGQDTALLGRWMAERGVPEITYDYYGTSDPEVWGVRSVPSWADARSTPLGGLFAVHVALIGRLPDTYAFLADRQPLTVLGNTIRVYDLDPPVLTRP